MSIQRVSEGYKSSKPQQKQTYSSSTFEFNQDTNEFYKRAEAAGINLSPAAKIALGFQQIRDNEDR